MTQKGLVSDLVLDANLFPTKELGAVVQAKMWQSILANDFRNGLGKPEIDHITMARGGEAHVEFDKDGISITMYDDGNLRILDEKFSEARSIKFERIISTVSTFLTRITGHPVKIDVNIRLHMTISDVALRKFIKDGVRFTGTKAFLKALGRYKGMKSVLLKLSDHLDMIIFYPDHIDFLYHDTITSSHRKLLVRAMAVTSMNYLKTMRKYAA